MPGILKNFNQMDTPEEEQSKHIKIIAAFSRDVRAKQSYMPGDKK